MITIIQAHISYSTNITFLSNNEPVKTKIEEVISMSQLTNHHHKFNLKKRKSEIVLNKNLTWKLCPISLEHIIPF